MTKTNYLTQASTLYTKLLNQFKQRNLTRQKERLRQIMRFAYRNASEHRIGQVAGSLTFTTTLSLVPLLAVALAIFTAFPLFNQFRIALEQFMTNGVMPQHISLMIIKYLNQFAAKAKGLTTVGIIFLVLTATTMLITIERVFNQIWRVQKARPLVQRVLIYWAIISLGPILFGASLSATSYLASMSEELITGTPWFERWLLRIFPIILITLAYAALYVMVPNRQVLWRDALFGGLIAALAFELMKRGFAFYITKFPAYTAVYGAFAALPIFLLWIFLSWLVTLFGATIVATIPLLREGRWQREPHPGLDFLDALTLIKALYATRSNALPGLPLEPLCRQIKLNPYDAERLLLILRTHGFVALTQDQPARWVWVGDVQRLTLFSLYQHLVLHQQYLQRYTQRLPAVLQDNILWQAIQKEMQEAASLHTPLATLFSEQK